MKFAAQFGLLSSGGFLLVGLITGVWKYRHMMASDDGTAPRYVNIAHRASLLYAFASLVLMELVLRSPFTPAIELGAVAAPVLFFSVAVSTYVAQGLTRQTDNMLRDPPVPRLQRPLMWSLVVAELGGASLLVAGFVTGSAALLAVVALVLTLLAGSLSGVVVYVVSRRGRPVIS